MQITIDIPDEFLAKAEAAHERRMQRMSVADRVPFEFNEAFCTKVMIGILGGIMTQDEEEQLVADAKAARAARESEIAAMTAPQA